MVKSFRMNSLHAYAHACMIARDSLGLAPSSGARAKNPLAQVDYVFLEFTLTGSI